MNCPNCQISLSMRQTALGIVWSCPQCNGRAVGFELLRRTVAADFMNDLWQKAANEAEPNGKVCPSCSLTMKQVTEQGVADPVTIDLCQRCHFLWFDAHEVEALPILPPKPAQNADAQLPQDGREAIARAKVAMMAENARRDEWKGPGGRPGGNVSGDLFSGVSAANIFYDLVRWLVR